MLRLIGTVHFAYESNKETSNKESFADDSSSFVLFEFETLSKVKNILSCFRFLSGLECNVERSYLMRFGNLEGEASPEILGLGFPLVNSVTVLGFFLQNNGDFEEANFNIIRTKILKIIRFWERFNLSFPGKITVYKTLLIPQINFIASILTPSDQFVTEISYKLEKFVTEGFNISREKLYSNVSAGGIGMFDLNNFISALQVSWMKRATVNTNDNW